MAYKHYFILDDDGEPQQVATALEWGRWLHEHVKERIIRQDTLPYKGKDLQGDNPLINNKKGIRVSTVFLGLNHAFGDGPPLLFETMIFGGPNDQYCARYSTRQEALIGHDFALTIATVKIKDESHELH